MVIEPSGGTAFPADARLTVGGTNYYLNAQGNFLVPLKPVQTGNGAVTVSYHSQTSEQVTLQIELWASATANGAKPLMGDPVVSNPVNVSVEAQTKPSFKVISMGNRLLEKEDLSNAITVSFGKRDASTVTIELQKKSGAGYVTGTTILESVDGITAADAGKGKFTVKDSGSTTIKLSELADVGTYRLLFTASSTDGVTTEVPYNFIIVE